MVCSCTYVVCADYKRGNGEMIHTLLAEAENERKHLMFMMEVVHPSGTSEASSLPPVYLLALLSGHVPVVPKDSTPDGRVL